MSLEESVEIECPYCGEQIVVLIDCTAGRQEYVEDCQVCCRPITLAVTIDTEGLPRVHVRRDDE